MNGKSGAKLMYPTMHKPIPVGTRVRVPAGYACADAITGTIVGISSWHVVFMYIVSLDVPLDTDYGMQSAIVVHGPSLESEDGTANWKFRNNEDMLNYLREINASPSVELRKLATFS